MAPPRTRLRLTKLDFLSLVDTPAQETATFRLIKRATGDQLEGTMRIVKVGSGDNPLVHGWAFTCTDEHGRPYHDLQGDAVTADFVKAVEDWLASGGAIDEMHRGEQTARIAFAYPIDADVITAMLGKDAGQATKVSGLMAAVRPTPEQLVKIRSGEYNGFSIAGVGIREPVDKAAPKCPACGAYGEAAAETCASCGATMKAATRAAKGVLSTADRDSLPDTAFLYVESGGKKDADGKTTPRSLRHFPYRTGAGAIDVVHLRAACHEIPTSSLPADLRDKLQVRAEKLLAAQHDRAAKRAPLRKQTVLTSAVDGHQHTIDLDDPADEWRDDLSTSYQTAEGATQSHSHAWTYDPTTGAITIAEDSGHDHTVDAVVPAEVIRQAALNDSGERCSGCGELCEQHCRYCPSCGASLDRRDGVPSPASNDDSGSGPSLAVIALRAGAGISTPSQPIRSVRGTSQENPMDPKFAKMLAASFALPERHRAHVAKLAPDDQATFLGLDTAGRDAAVAAADAADPEVYKTASGLSIRKSHGPVAEQMARQADSDRAELAKQSQLFEIEKAERMRVQLEKRATDLIPLIGKSLADRVAIVKAVDGITDDAVRNGAIEALKGANAAFKQLGVPIGTDDGGAGPVSKSPVEAWHDGLAAFAKSKNIANPLDAIGSFLKTPEGKTAKAALDAQRPGGVQPS